MTQVWDANMPAPEKIVLLALADCANDQGGCWPSISTLKAKTNLSERKVQMAIKWLKENGHLTREEKPGKGVFYTVHPRTACTPAPHAPPHDVHPTPAQDAPHPRTTCTQTIKNHKEPSKASAIAKPDDVSQEIWEDFKALRKAKRAPITKTVIAALRTQSELAGWTLDAALTECVMRGWQGFKADWLSARGQVAKPGYSSTDSQRLRAKYGKKVFDQ